MITKFIISKRKAETDSIYLKVADGAVLNIKAKSIDEQGNLLDGYSFVGVKLNIRSEKELNINTHIKYNNLLSKVTMTMRSIWVSV